MRRGFGRRPRGVVGRRLTLWVLPALLVLAVFWYISAVTSFLHRTQSTPGSNGSGKGIACVAWRQTRSCVPYGVRDIGGDQDCQAWISRYAGYCECEGGLTTKRQQCGAYRPFTCEQACARLSEDMSEAEQLPANVTCPDHAGHESTLLGAAAEWLHTYSGSSHSHHLSSYTLASIREMDGAAGRLWQAIRAPLDVAGQDPVRLPESRTVHVDWVRDGVSMPKEDIRAAREQWQRYVAEAPEYPSGMFQGRGIVILAGGLTYMVPSWVNIHMLRRSGCTLPVEMFFPRKEYPTPALEAALADLGVTCRRLPDSRAAAAELELLKQPIADSQPGLSGFTMKIAALILSQFREVIFLDSDNVAVADPNELFNSEEYRATGATLWPDYWRSSAAPDLAAILDVQALPEGTFESGQMVFDKQRVWPGLLLAAYFNMQSELYYELFSNYMGKGDKESFAHALQAMRIPYSVVRQPVGSLGEYRKHCQPSGSCEVLFLGNTMTQYAPDGRLMFLHTNLSPKWNLEIPGNFSLYRRRWKTIVPGNADFVGKLGDLEWEVYRILVALRCAAFLPSYVEVLSMEDRMGEGKGLSMGLRGYHAFNPGVEFRQAFRWGLSGPYLAFTRVSILDRLGYFVNTSVRSRLGYCRRVFRSATRLFRKQDPYFQLW